MQPMRERPPALGARKLERAIILQLLSQEVAERSSCAQLAAALGRDQETLTAPLGSLMDAGVVCCEGTDVWASAAARRLDEFGLIAI
jgi:DNA-binding transcriptional ArsR family regulator